MLSRWDGEVLPEMLRRDVDQKKHDQRSALLAELEPILLDLKLTTHKQLSEFRAGRDVDVCEQPTLDELLMSP